MVSLGRGSIGLTQTINGLEDGIMPAGVGNSETSKWGSTTYLDGLDALSGFQGNRPRAKLLELPVALLASQWNAAP